MREILAAWIVCCGLAGLAAVLVTAGEHRTDAAPDPYAGVRNPGQGVAGARSPSVEDEFADADLPPAGEPGAGAVPSASRRPRLVAEAPRCRLYWLAHWRM
ncbi:MAG TPA: hypothetical protein VMB84_10590 [Stellaceae bacterium]|nr:hypothetical protein [Stellaceae bacterium]